MNASLDGMTQAKWDSLPQSEREKLRDNSGLTPQLVGLEGWRVEALAEGATQTTRFIVGKSTGWRPCHLCVSRRNARGGSPAAKSYTSVRKLYRVR